MANGKRLLDSRRQTANGKHEKWWKNIIAHSHLCHLLFAVNVVLISPSYYSDVDTWDTWDRWDIWGEGGGSGGNTPRQFMPRTI